MMREAAVARSPAGPTRWSAPPAGAALPRGEVHVFAFALDLPESQVPGVHQLLSEDELARAVRFRFPKDRRRYIVGRARLRMMLGRYVEREPGDLQFRYGSHGKPDLLGGGAADRIRFNLSRSAGLGIMAVQLDEDLGIDIERIRPFVDALQVAERLFAPDEYRELQRLPSGQCSAAFFRYWTRKEAVGKSLGLGLSYPMDAFTLSREPGGPPERLVLPSDHGTVTRWCLSLPEPRGGYVAALATAGSPPLLRCWNWPEG